MVKEADSKSAGISRAGSNPAAVEAVCQPCGPVKRKVFKRDMWNFFFSISLEAARDWNTKFAFEACIPPIGSRSVDSLTPRLRMEFIWCAAGSVLHSI